MSNWRWTPKGIYDGDVPIVWAAQTIQGELLIGVMADYEGALLAALDSLEACEAALRYDEAIRQCADDPTRMSSFCTATGENLDALYADWQSKAVAALAKAKGTPLPQDET